MFGFGPATRIYIAYGATDMRKNFNGLYGLVRDRRAFVNINTCPLSGSQFRVAAIISVIESCRRLKIPVCIAELTPAAWVAKHAIV